MKAKPWLRTCLIASLTGIALSASAALMPAISDEFNGQDAPEISIPSLKGENVSLKQLRGKVVLVNIFASWCPPCRSEINQLIKLQQGEAKGGVAIIGIAVDSIETPDTVPQVKQLIDKLKVPYPVGLATEQITKDYHYKGFPATIVINREGKIAKTFYGYHDGKAIEEVVQKLGK